MGSLFCLVPFSSNQKSLNIVLFEAVVFLDVHISQANFKATLTNGSTVSMDVESRESEQSGIHFVYRTVEKAQYALPIQKR